MTLYRQGNVGSCYAASKKIGMQRFFRHTFRESAKLLQDAGLRRNTPDGGAARKIPLNTRLDWSTADGRISPSASPLDETPGMQAAIESTLAFALIGSSSATAAATQPRRTTQRSVVTMKR